MSCKRTEEIVDAVLLGEMNASLSKHMAVCDECRMAATAAEPSGVVLQAARTEKAPDGLWARVEAELATQDKTRGLSPLPMRRLWLVPASAAALLAVLISVWAGWPQAPAGSVGPDLTGPIPDAEFYVSEHWNVEEEYVFSGASLSGNAGNGGS